MRGTKGRPRLLGVDTNVLVRWLENDDVVQAEQANGLLTSGEPVFLSEIVLAETTWVLTSIYRHSRASVASAMRTLLALPDVRVDRDSVVWSALAAFEAGGGGFADHLIGAGNAASGCRTTYTFDRAAAKGPSFTSI
jgi:predicted nucleic-acid-binding protein